MEGNKIKRVRHPQAQLSPEFPAENPVALGKMLRGGLIIEDEMAASGGGSGGERTLQGGKGTSQDQTQELFTSPKTPRTLLVTDPLVQQPPDANKLLRRAALAAPDTPSPGPRGGDT